MPPPPLGPVTAGNALKITSPKANDSFFMTDDAKLPSILLTTNLPGKPHSWQWTIEWKTFKKSGSATSFSNTFDIKASIENLGGTLTVKAVSGTSSAQVVVKVRGKQCTEAGVTAYLATKANSGGFNKILKHESKMKHFDAEGEPIKSFDNGYGVCQLTSPAPTYEQAWSWKKNIDAGMTLFSTKRSAAVTYLTQGGRTATEAQIQREAICRWNGGAYHVWVAGKWVRDSNMLCDTATGNIGWDMTDARNAGKTEATLRQRDKASYAGGRKSGDPWKYSGVCYADRIMGS